MARTPTPTRQTPGLELRPPQLRANLLALLEGVQRDKRAMAAFIRNPTKAITSQVTRTTLTTQQVSEANRLTFALIANDDMRKWLGEFEPAAGTAAAQKKEFAGAFARKVASLKDPNILTALVGNSLAQNGIPGLSEVAYQCVCNETTKKTSTTCTPVAKAMPAFENSTITPDVVRGMSESMVAHAKDLAQQGALGNLEQTIG